MTNNRRSFIKLVALSVGALAFPVKGAFAAVKTAKRSPVPFSTILKSAYEDHIAHAINADSPFFSRFLNQAVKDGRIRLVPVAASVEFLNPSGPVSTYDMSYLTIPHVWTDKDERENTTDTQMVHLATSIIIGGVRMHDEALIEKLADHDLVVSTDYRYRVSDVRQMESSGGNYILLSTPITELPKNYFALRAVGKA